MKDFIYRPWGRPTWLAQQTKLTEWTIIGCISTEQRSVASALSLSKFAKFAVMVSISDPQPAEHAMAILERRQLELQTEIQCPYTVKHAELGSPLDVVQAIILEALEQSPNIVLDITSFPKRWFFPLVRLLSENERVASLHVAYTKGDGYAQVLSENPEPLRPLPSFACMDTRSVHDHAFIGIGFNTQSLVTMFGDEKVSALNMLFPFPPGPPGTKKGWMFARDVRRISYSPDDANEQRDAISYRLLEAVDVSHAFDILRITTENAQKTAILAPYGPKTFSLAMCLFAIAADRSSKPEVPAYYSQPQRYAINYTEKAVMVDCEPDTLSYAIKHNGRHLYNV
jgi:hypothetical protein